MTDTAPVKTIPSVHPLARQLVIDAIQHGWNIAYNTGMDTGRNPFVTVEGGRERDGEPEYFRVTWHTRDTGTYRLFHASYGKWKHSGHDVPLKVIQEAVRAA